MAKSSLTPANAGSVADARYIGILAVILDRTHLL